MGKGGVIRSLRVDQKGCLSEAHTYKASGNYISQELLDKDRKNDVPKLSFTLIVDTVRGPYYYKKNEIRFNIEWKTVKEWEQHRLPVAQVAQPAPKKADSEASHDDLRWDPKLMFAAMKPRRRLMMSDVSNPFV